MSRSSPGYPVAVPTAPLDVIRAWNRAAEDRDADALAALVHDDFEMVTMHRGTQHGPEAMRGWVERQAHGLGMHVVPRRFFARGETVAAETIVEMRWVESGEVAERSEGAVVFEVRDGLIQRLTVHPGIDAALEAGGLEESDEAQVA